MILKRIRFALRGAMEIFRATKSAGCDSPLIMMTRDDVQQQMDDMNRMAAEKGLLYHVIDHMVEGGSPCMWCRDYDGCDHVNKGGSAPCCGIWDLVEIAPADDKEGAHEPAAAQEES